MRVLDAAVPTPSSAYDLETGELRGELLPRLLEEIVRRCGIWSDGVALWVADHVTKRLLKAYLLTARPDAPAA